MNFVIICALTVAAGLLCIACLVVVTLLAIDWFADRNPQSDKWSM